MKKFKKNLMKNIYKSEEVSAPDEETAIRVIEDMIENGIDESFIEEDGWHIDQIVEVDEEEKK